MLIQLTVGKVDAGVAVLLTADNRLIEFPSILLPPSITSGSIVDITVSQNTPAETALQKSFKTLQTQILDTYGLYHPDDPDLRLRAATQTSLILEWDKLSLATSKLKSLTLYRNGAKAGVIPRPHEMLATKISGLAVDTAYKFHLILRTTGGTYSSPLIEARTHKMTDLTGIAVTAGVLPDALRTSLERAVERIGGKMIDGVKIDTTHFVCTAGAGADWQRAVDMSIPVVRPEWVEGCEREGRIVGVRAYYLDANPKNRQVGSNPSIAGTGSSGVGAAIAAAGGALAPTSSRQSQVDLPERGRSDNPRPVGLGVNARDQSSDVEGEPGPEVPPTPPPKSANMRLPTAAEAKAAAEEDEEPVSPITGSEESDDGTEDGRGPAPNGQSKGKQREGEPSPRPAHQATVEDDSDGDGDGDGDLEEVSL